jgi:hypothetical protein
MVFIFVHHSRSKFRKAFNAFFLSFCVATKNRTQREFRCGMSSVFLENDVRDFSVMEEKFHLSILLGLESFSFSPSLIFSEGEWENFHLNSKKRKLN